jgi:hypothetical protein
MAILDYEIGGNEVKTDASEAINAIPENRSLIVERLTADEPVNPEAVTGLGSIEAVFERFRPNVDISFTDSNGQPVRENFKFANVGDFSVGKMTGQSDFLRNLSEQEEFYETLTKQLRSNKVLQRALADSRSKAAFISALTALKKELEAE